MFCSSVCEAMVFWLNASFKESSFQMSSICCSGDDAAVLANIAWTLEGRWTCSFMILGQAALSKTLKDCLQVILLKNVVHINSPMSP